MGSRRVFLPSFSFCMGTIQQCVDPFHLNQCRSSNFFGNFSTRSGPYLQSAKIGIGQASGPIYESDIRIVKVIYEYCKESLVMLSNTTFVCSGMDESLSPAGFQQNAESHSVCACKCCLSSEVFVSAAWFSHSRRASASGAAHLVGRRFTLGRLVCQVMLLASSR